MNFQTKSDTLKKVSGQIKSAKVLPQISFTVFEWNNNSEKIVKSIELSDWMSIPLIIRSSAIAEDSTKESLAGHFKSVLNCIGIDKVKMGIEEVSQSYKDRNDDDIIFIQPMLLDVKMSGVAFSKDPNTGSPYYVINYDDFSNTTDSVTSGNTNNTNPHSIDLFIKIIIKI